MEKAGLAGDKQKCDGIPRKESQKDKYCNKNIGKSSSLPQLVPERFVAVARTVTLRISNYGVGSQKKQNGSRFIMQAHKKHGRHIVFIVRIRYTCTCGAFANLGGAFGNNALSDIDYYCRGNMPWLGVDAQGCGRPLTVLQRGASNLWFADIISSVYIRGYPSSDGSH
jgi:hypothetical protein